MSLVADIANLTHQIATIDAEIAKTNKCKEKATTTNDTALCAIFDTRLATLQTSRQEVSTKLDALKAQRQNELTAFTDDQKKLLDDIKVRFSGKYTGHMRRLKRKSAEDRGSFFALYQSAVTQNDDELCEEVIKSFVN